MSPADAADYAASRDSIAAALAAMNTCRCPNCDWSGALDDLRPIRDYGERVADDEEPPDGECPECGALVHEEDTP